jgi:hypothetical protein
MHGMPIAIIALMALQRSCIIDMPDASIGIIRHVIPSFVISTVIRHIIGIAIIGMPPIIVPGIIPGIMPGIIGIPPIIPGIWPGIIPFIIIGMPMPMPIIGMGMGIIIGMLPAFAGLMPPIIDMAFMGVIVRSSPAFAARAPQT